MMSHMQNIIGQWLQCLKHYILMCLLVSSPNRLPYNPYCTAVTVFIYFLIGLLLVDEQRAYSTICSQIVLELGMLGMIAYWGLLWQKSLPRFLQTFTALAGINMVITAATVPVYRSMTLYESDMESLLIYTTLAILVWNLAVLSLIFKRSFEIPTFLSAMIAFIYFVLYQFIVIWLS